MSPPDIFTRKDYPSLTCKTRPEEPAEAVRAAVKNTVAVAWGQIELGRPDIAKKMLATRLGMPEELADRLVAAARKGIPGVTVRFETVFLRRSIRSRIIDLVTGKNVRPREYRNFELIEPPRKTR